MKVHASFEYVGYSDYWGGNGRRWDRNAGCAFAFYGKETTLKDIVDQWVEDTWMGGDGFEDWPEEIGDDDIRAAILDMLSDAGRADYDSGALCEWAADLEDCDCGEEDCDCDEYCESPIAVVLLEYDACPDCGKPSGDDTTDELCDACDSKHYGEV